MLNLLRAAYHIACIAEEIRHAFECTLFLKFAEIFIFQSTIVDVPAERSKLEMSVVDFARTWEHLTFITRTI
jgi:hypothetical protein